MSEQHIAQRVEDWIRPEIRALNAYHVPPAQGLIKLDAMENPYGWPEEMRNEWLQILREAEINRYPDPGATALTARLREAVGVPEHAGMLLGNGSDELIQIIALAMAGRGRAIVAPDPSFVMYRMIADFAGYQFVPVPLADDFTLDVELLCTTVRETRPAITFIAYPNNPTGNLFPAEAIEAVADCSPGLVIVDEAYGPFTDASFLPRVGEYDNLLVMGTVSKLGLAGLRLGCLAGPTEWISQFDKLRLPYNINVLTQATAEFALRHMSVFRAQTLSIKAERERLSAELATLPGVRVFPSEANFILFRVSGSAPQLFADLKSRGVLIKSMDGSAPLLSGCLRATVGKPAENDALLTALRELLD
jgi:histidinol-phosphate aminotransferase